MSLSSQKSANFGVKDTWELICRHELCVSREIEEKVWGIIESHYSESRRFYHTLEHIFDLISVLSPFISKISDQNAVLLSILFHDIIYDPTSSRNEEDSAELFEELLSTSLEKHLVQKVVNYIIATKSHQALDKTDQDLLFFLDCDMSILGRSRNKYAEYSKQIRQEYIHVDNIAFNSGRSSFLKTILTNDGCIFLTAEFQLMMEKDARENIKWEIDKLECNGAICEG